MAKQSIKARQRKREAMVAKYAAKRAALKAAGDYQALDLLPKKCLAGAVKKSLPAYRKTKRVYALFRRFENSFPRYGTQWKNSRCA